MRELIHDLSALAACSLITSGLWIEIGAGWALAVLGGLVLAAVVYARVFATAPPSNRDRDAT